MVASAMPRASHARYTSPKGTSPEAVASGGINDVGFGQSISDGLAKSIAACGTRIAARLRRGIGAAAACNVGNWRLAAARAVTNRWYGRSLMSTRPKL